MDPLTAGIITGGMQLIAGKNSDDASAKQANNQMDFQREMSNTAHQREVEDLRRAGLNPILSALGNGASSPAGAAGQVTDKGQAISSGASTAMALRQQKMMQPQILAGIANTQADTLNKASQADLMRAQTSSANQEAKMKAMQTQQAMDLFPNLLKKAEAEGNYAEPNQIMGLIQGGASSAGDLLGIAKQFKGITKGFKDFKLPSKTKP